MIAPLLEEGLAKLGLEENTRAVRQMEQYAQMLLEKNQVMNLTAITDPADVAALHFLDCAALLNYCGFTNRRLLDVGTGAGFPGMVLKILVPSLDVTLLDSQNKRLAWLEEVCRALDLKGIRTVHARAEETGRDPAFREQFDLVTSRAVAALPVLAELCLPYVKTGGSFLAMKSVDSDQELAGADNAIRLLGGTLEAVRDYQIPAAGVSHRVILLKKERSTPEKYPRPFAKIKKTPL